jgi:hypothetical protein
MSTHRVFISYSTVDKAVAEDLYRDLCQAGAEAFQFAKSAKIGKPSWRQLLTWISQSDTFVVLVSASSLASDAVGAEIDHAHYAHINARKPSRLIPALIARNLDLPVEIQRFATVDLSDYQQGLARMIDELGLTRSRPAKQSPVKRWSLFEDTEELYRTRDGSPPSLVAPPSSSFAPPTTSTSFDRSIPLAWLRQPTVKESAPSPTPAASEESFLRLQPGFQPPQTTPPSDAGARAPVRFRVSTPNLRFVPPDRFEWDLTLGARGYVLESSFSEAFDDAKVAYAGEETSATINDRLLSWFDRWFRVKASGLLGADSDWSLPVHVPGSLQPRPYDPPGETTPTSGATRKRGRSRK